MIEHIWNSYSKQTTKVGGTIPVLCAPALKRQYGAKVDTKGLRAGERIAAGTPFYFDNYAKTARFFKFWEITNVSTSDSTSTVTLKRTAVSPILYPNTPVMVVPSNLGNNAKVASCGEVVQEEGSYKVTLTTASFDTLTKGGFLAEAPDGDTTPAKLGGGKLPNSISLEDTVVGSEETLVDIPRGHVYMYINTIPAMPTKVQELMFNNDIQVSWEYFNDN